MATLDEILNNDLGLGETATEKVASVSNENEIDEIEKLAMELGLTEGSSSPSQETNNSHIKEAGMSLDNLYSNLFPDDADVVSSQEKTASIDKEAAEIEGTMGAYAFDKAQEFIDAHITKIASDIVALPADGTPPQSMKSNEDKSNKAMDTSPEIQDDALNDDMGGNVGDFSKQKSPDGELKTAAIMKHLLLAQEEGV